MRTAFMDPQEYKEETGEAEFTDGRELGEEEVDDDVYSDDDVEDENIIDDIALVKDIDPGIIPDEEES